METELIKINYEKCIIDQGEELSNKILTFIKNIHEHELAIYPDDINRQIYNVALFETLIVLNAPDYGKDFKIKNKKTASKYLRFAEKYYKSFIAVCDSCFKWIKK